MSLVARFSAVSLSFIPVFLFCACVNHVYDDTRDWACNTKAEKLYLDGRKLEAVKFMDSACASGNMSPLCQYLSYSRKTRYYYDLPDLAKSMLYADSSINVLKKYNIEDKYTKEYAHALLEKGHVYSALGKYDSAYNSYMQGYSFVVTTGNKFAMHEFDYFIGMILFRQENIGKARMFFLRSFDEANSCQPAERPWYRMQEILDNIGLTFPPDTNALKYFDSCLSFIAINSSRFHSQDMTEDALATCYKNKGLALLNMDRYAEAKDCISKTIDIYSRRNDKYKDFLLERKLDLGVILYYTDDTVGLTKLWREIRPVAEISDARGIREKWLQVSFMYYELNLDYEHAFYAYVQYRQYRDNLNNIYTDVSKKDIIQDMQNREQAYKIQLLTKDAQLQRNYFWIAASISLFAIVIILLVYTGYKRIRKNNILISSQKVALEKSNREKIRILNVVAHDLRSPVSAVAYLADSIIEDGEEASMSAEAALEIIKNSSLNSLQLINELSAFARDEQQELKTEITSVNDIIESSVKLLAQKAAGKGIDISMSLPAHAINARLDKNKFARVIGNLIDNAIKFSKSGASIYIILSETGGRFEVQVRDSGIGIPPHLLPELFEIFTPSGRAGTKGERSFGLGLSISRQIVEAHGGKIWVESAEGKGSTFYVQLPLR